MDNDHIVILSVASFITGFCWGNIFQIWLREKLGI